MKKQTRGLLLTAILLWGLPYGAQSAQAKTIHAEPVQHVLFYGKAADGAAVLLKDFSMDELNKLSHGQPDGENYYQSMIDNYPAIQYCESKGVTIPELVQYAAHTTTAAGGDKLDFTVGDRIGFMAMDSYGNFSKSLSWEELCGEEHYYFGLLHDKEQGWNPDWEIQAEKDSSEEAYRGLYQEDDRNYGAKQIVLEQGEKTEVILAVQSSSGRVGSETQGNSMEAGIDAQIRENNGVLEGCLGSYLNNEYALRLCIPMTKADLLYGRRTAYDNMKWICAMELDMGADTPLEQRGTVSPPEVSIQKQGDQLMVSMTCPTPDVSLYYGRDGAAQNLYTGPFTLDVSGRNLDQDPLMLYAAAVREGYADAGLQKFSYPAAAPDFQSQYTGAADRDLTFSPGQDISSGQWGDWIASLEQISMKRPGEAQYGALDRDAWSIAPTTSELILSRGLFSVPGTYSFLFHGTGYADKTVSIIMKKEAPQLEWMEQSAAPVELLIPDEEYGKGLSVYLLGQDQQRTLIPSAKLDQSVPERLRIDPEVFPASEGPGTSCYTLEFVNNRYVPAVQHLTIQCSGSFFDVPTTAWYRDAVHYVTERGYFSGTAAHLFSPNGEMTRAMFATVLWRMEGKPEVEQTGAFLDVPKDAWYADGVAWAASRGIVTGMGQGSFCPDTPITREQLAVMLCRYAGGKNETGDLNRFSDVASISPYAVESMGWAAAHGCFSGDAEGRLLPRETASRGQVAQILMNYDKSMEMSGEM